MEKTTAEIEARNKSLKITMLIVMVMLVLMLTGCTALRQGEARDIECRVLGLDASIPVPFAQNVNVVNVRLGWIETKYGHTYKSKITSHVKQSITYLGSVDRESFTGTDK